MKTHARRTAPLGELVVAAFDWAARYSSDPREVSRLATGAVTRILQSGKATSATLSLRALRSHLSLPRLAGTT